MRSYLYYIFLLLLFSATGIHAQKANKPRTIKGKVTDAQNESLPFASITLVQTGVVTSSLRDGLFFIDLPADLDAVTLSVSYVGMQTSIRTIDAAQFDQLQVITLRELSLSLKDVQITGTRRGNTSNSSFLFDREAIEQMQAFSLADILNRLPGKLTTAPQLQNPQAITLRTAATGNYAMSNSLGTAIVLDGIRQSNDANMQGLNLSRFGMSGSTVGSYQHGSFDVPFSGIDLRDIPVENIEKVEVVTGVASAKYGDLTDGAVIIERQAGKTRYQAGIRINNGSTDFSLSKGFGLGKKWGAINISAGYLNSNQDPRDKIKSYNRITTGIMWTNNLLPGLKNTLSLDYNTKLDDVTIDPDDDALHKSYSKSRTLRISNRLSLALKKKFIKNIGLNLSYSTGYQDSYDQWLLNGVPKGMASKDTTGIYEGYFIPGNYLAEERVIGKPVDFSARLNLISNTRTGIFNHDINYGVEYSRSINKGEGVVINPDRPRWASYNGQGERPYNYDLSMIGQSNYGFYAEDNISGKIAKRMLNTNIGVRYDIQNGWASVQPRINFRYKLSRQIEINLAYGISSKSPTLAHRYPSPAWLDIPLLNLYTGFANQSLFLVYTQKIITDNSNLKPSNSRQLEAGIRYNSAFLNISAYGYFKQNRNGFNSYNKFVPLTLPEYGYTYTAGQKIEYFPTGGTVTYATPSMYVITNSLSSDNYGIDFSMQTRKLDIIRTSFTLNGALSYSSFENSGDQRIIAANQSQIDAGKKAWYGVYSPNENRNLRINSSVSSDTHIPELGFVISLSSDIQWKNRTRTSLSTLDPIGYIDSALQYHGIEKFDKNNPDYGYLRLSDNVNLLGEIPFPLANLHLRITKEIKNAMRISVSIFNVLSKTTEYYNVQAATTVTYARPMSITAGFSMRL